MISKQAVNYAKALISLGITKDSIEHTKNLLQSSAELLEVLENPVIHKKEKEAVIDALFETEMGSYLKVLSEHQVLGLFPQIADAYQELDMEHRNILKAKLVYAVKPENDQLYEMKKMLCDRYHKSDIILELKEDTSVIGGYVLYVKDEVYDKSIKGALSDMQKNLIGRQSFE